MSKRIYCKCKICNPKNKDAHNPFPNPIEEFNDGEWYRPKMNGFVHECCNCGAKHKIDFRLNKEKGNKIEFKWVKERE